MYYLFLVAKIGRLLQCNNTRISFHLQEPDIRIGEHRGEA